MKDQWARVQYQGRTWSALVQGDQLTLYEGNWLTQPGSAGPRISVSQAVWLPPVEPRTILCVGRNYRAHAAELNNAPPKEPLFFLKQWGSLTSHQAPIYRPSWVGRVDYEGELVLVIGKTVGRAASSREAMAAVAGITAGNDVTARELQKTDGQWTRAKGFDSFAPVGPWVALESHPEGRSVTTTVNGEVKQRGSTDDLIFPCDQLIMEASRFMTLYPGDLIFTGTPAGVGPLQEGDVVEVSVQGVGKLSNSVKNGD